jgi:hypothetical protein
MKGWANELDRVLAVANEGVAGTGGGDAAAGANSAGGSGGAAPAPSGGQDGQGAGSPPPDTRPWYEQRTWGNEALKNHLVKSGYHMGSPDDALEKALQGELTAATRLGKPASALLDAPGKDQKPSDWLKANARVFGVPEDATAYNLTLPQNLPEGTPLDEAMLAEARMFGHAAGVPPDVMQAMVDFYGKTIGGRITRMGAEAATAEARITADLQKDWGAAYDDNMAMARRAFGALMTEMKMPPEAQKLAAESLAGALGGTTTMKLLHHIAGKMGEDSLAMPKGASGVGMSKAVAAQRKEQIMAPMDGEMAMAMRAGNQAKINALQEELRGLNLMVAGG